MDVLNVPIRCLRKEWQTPRAGDFLRRRAVRIEPRDGRKGSSLPRARRCTQTRQSLTRTRCRKRIGTDAQESIWTRTNEHDGRVDEGDREHLDDLALLGLNILEPQGSQAKLTANPQCPYSQSSKQCQRVSPRVRRKSVAQKSTRWCRPSLVGTGPRRTKETAEDADDDEEAQIAEIPRRRRIQIKDKRAKIIHARAAQMPVSLQSIEYV